MFPISDCIPPTIARVEHSQAIKKKSSRCSNFGDTVETDSPSNSDEFEEVIYPQDSPKRGQTFRDFDNLSPPTSQESNRTRQPKNKSSRCFNFGDNVESDSSSNSDELEEVIY